MKRLKVVCIIMIQQRAKRAVVFGFEGIPFEELLGTAENAERSHVGLRSKTFSSIAQW